MHKLRIVPMARRWLISFMISHIAGWLTAYVQTGWIVSEIRKAANDIKRQLQK